MMPKKMIPAYPDGDQVASATIAVRLSSLELAVLDYMVKHMPDGLEHSRGGLLRSVWRGCVRPAGMVASCSNVKELRAILKKNSLLALVPWAEVVPDRLIVVASDGRYTFGKDIDVAASLDFAVLGSGKTTFVFEKGSQNSVDLARFFSCSIEIVEKTGTYKIEKG